MTCTAAAPRILDTALPDPSRDPGSAGMFPLAPAGSGVRSPGNRQVRGSGRDPSRSAGVSPGGTPSAGHRRTRRPKRVPHSLPAGLDRCRAGRGWGGNQTGVECAGAGLGLGRSVQGWAGLGRIGAGAGAGPGLGRGSP